MVIPLITTMSKSTGKSFSKCFTFCTTSILAPSPKSMHNGHFPLILDLPWLFTKPRVEQSNKLLLTSCIIPVIVVIVGTWDNSTTGITLLLSFVSLGTKTQNIFLAWLQRGWAPLEPPTSPSTFPQTLTCLNCIHQWILCTIKTNVLSETSSSTALSPLDVGVDYVGCKKEVAFWEEPESEVKLEACLPIADSLWVNLNPAWEVLNGSWIATILSTVFRHKNTTTQAPLFLLYSTKSTCCK